MPYTDAIMRILPVKGVRYIQVIVPGFAADCLEILQEIIEHYCKWFLNSGGEKFEYISALNVNNKHIAMMVQPVDMYR